MSTSSRSPCTSLASNKSVCHCFQRFFFVFDWLVLVRPVVPETADAEPGAGFSRRTYAMNPASSPSSKRTDNEVLFLGVYCNDVIAVHGQFDVGSLYKTFSTSTTSFTPAAAGRPRSRTS